MTTATTSREWSMSSEPQQPQHGFWALVILAGAAIGSIFRGLSLMIAAATTGMKRLSALEIRVDSKEREVENLNIKIFGLERTIAELRNKDAEQQGELDHLKSELEIAKSERDSAIAQLAKLTHPEVLP